MKSAVKNWLIMAQNDLDTIAKIETVEHLTGMVFFHAEQAVEKSLKALLEQYHKEVVRTHNLLVLNGLVEKYVTIDVDLNLLSMLNDAYIDSRYPSELGILPNGRPSLADAHEIKIFAHSVFEKVKKCLLEKEQKTSH